MGRPHAGKLRTQAHVAGTGTECKPKCIGLIQAQMERHPNSCLIPRSENNNSLNKYINMVFKELGLTNEADVCPHRM
jgi:hypothetical protein